MSILLKIKPTEKIQDFTHALGLRIGFAKAEPPPRIDLFRRWLEEGKAGTMTYLHRSMERRANPELILPGARSVISVAQSYFTGGLPDEVKRDPSRGLIASYAWGADYHDVLLAKLEILAQFIESFTYRRVESPDSTVNESARGANLEIRRRERMPTLRDREVAGIRNENDGNGTVVETKCYVDTGHILERDFGETAGLGFIGKNTMLIQPRAGSYFFLGEILTTLELTPTPREPMPSCGSCTKCLTVCPTHALPAEYILDSNRCISYLTIEYKGVIARKLRSKMGNHIFGCDDCQDCCPWNRFAELTEEAAYSGMIERQAPKLTDLAAMTEADFASRFAGSAVLRPKHEGFMRNVAIALGNWGSQDAIEPLEHLSKQESPLIRLHAAWGLGQIKHEQSRKLLRRMMEDADDAVRREAADMLTENQNTP